LGELGEAGEPGQEESPWRDAEWTAWERIWMADGGKPPGVEEANDATLGDAGAAA